MRTIQQSVLRLCLLLVYILTACAPAPTESAVSAPATGAAEIPVTSAELTGASLFRLSCAACHGQDRTGSTFEVDGQTIKVPGLNWNRLSKSFAVDPARGSVPEQLALAIIKGQDAAGGELNAMMPRWSSLSPAQVDSLIQYIQTVDIAAAAEASLEPAAANLMGEQLYRTSCAACHGENAVGKTFNKDGNTITTPPLHWRGLSVTFSRDPGRGSVPEQLALAITRGQDEQGKDLNSMMPRWSFLSQAQVDSLIQYLQTAFKE